MSRCLPLIILGVMLNAVAQLALKQGMRTIGSFAFCCDNLTRIAGAVLTCPYILAGLFCYVVSVAVWLLVLSRVEVSFAYPLLSLGYIVTALAGWRFFGENLSLCRWSGIIIICIGVWLITRTG
jgi:multidrug transporter EmrE-like cation transporter